MFFLASPLHWRFKHFALIMKHAINVTVAVEFIGAYVTEDSDEQVYLFHYHITISNDSDVGVQLLRRSWHIEDANQMVQEVTGKGVVGEQPYLNPGEKFEYSSSSVIDTPVGTMQGQYHMLDDDGKPFDVEIPAFVLADKRQLN